MDMLVFVCFVLDMLGYLAQAGSAAMAILLIARSVIETHAPVAGKKLVHIFAVTNAIITPFRMLCNCAPMRWDYTPLLAALTIMFAGMGIAAFCGLAVEALCGTL